MVKKMHMWVVGLLILVVALFLFVYFAFIKEPWWENLLYSDDIHPVLVIPELEPITMTHIGREMRRRRDGPPRSVVYKHVFTIDNSTEFYISLPWFGNFWGMPGNNKNESFGYVLEFFDGAHWRMMPASYFDYILPVASAPPYPPMYSWEVAIDFNRIYGNLRRGLYRFRIEASIHWHSFITPEGYIPDYFPIDTRSPHHIIAVFYLA
ncbi:MAG: hypothetical protein FWC16_08005 [Defluviitaleaceae bacterium]|nr:hypothetical protein [Defluviitaleaceae bacterium]MCL2274856.1 hypothetical protein [Defluviitaleaceae bacterium]